MGHPSGESDDGTLWVDFNRRLTLEGRPFVRVAAPAFDRYLRSGTGRHALAV